MSSHQTNGHATSRTISKKDDVNVPTSHTNSGGDNDQARPILFCTYPQGESSLVPQVITLMAVFATLMAFPIFGDASSFFMCIQVKSAGRVRGQCMPLYVNTMNYWNDEDEVGWARAIQAGAVFGAFAGMIGMVALAQLISACCFTLRPSRLLTIIIMQGMCAFFTILTLVAGAADICKAQGLDDGSCSTDKVRMDTGAIFMVFAFILYILAGVMTLCFFVGEIGDRRRLGCTTTKEDIESGGRSFTRTEREYLGKDGKLIKKIVTIEKPGIQVNEVPSSSRQRAEGDEVSVMGDDSTFG